jgi:hypothetical protein
VVIVSSSDTEEALELLSLGSGHVISSRPLVDEARGLSSSSSTSSDWFEDCPKARNMINDYLRGRACIESVRGLISGGVLILSFSCSSELFLALLYHFACLCHFSCLLLAFVIVLLLDDLLELFLAFFVF